MRQTRAKSQNKKSIFKEYIHDQINKKCTYKIKTKKN